MKNKICRSIPWVIVAAGAALVILALSAGVLGIDTDIKWGPFRKGILVLGLAGLILPFGLRLLVVIDERLLKNQKFQAYREVSRRTVVDVPHTLAGLNRIQQLTGLGVLIVAIELLYVGLTSVWNWTYWPPTTSYYHFLAEAFANHQTALLIEPPPELAEIENPYPLDERRNIAAIGDFTYFEGKYYLYWGPVPAVIISVFYLLGSEPIGDQYIVFIAISGVFIFMTLTLLYLQRTYHPQLPVWLLAFSLVIAATAHPILWVLSSPSIYEAAIACGQAFLIAGLYFALPLLDGTQRPVWRFALVGVLWVLALGSRYTLIGAVGIFALSLVIVQFFQAKESRNWQKPAFRIATLLSPLVIGSGILALYNYTRFRNIFETGIRYAFTPFDFNLLIQKGQLFNPVYILPNLVYYLLAPIRLIERFPFIRPVWDEWPPFTQFFSRFAIPEVHHIDSISGQIFAMPVLLFYGYLILELVCNWPSTATKLPDDGTDSQYLVRSRWGLQWVTGVILVATLVAFIPVMVYFYVAARFFLDAIPLFSLLVTLGLWGFYASYKPFPLRRVLATLLILGTGILSILVSFVLALSGPASRFDDFNPTLFQFLVELFSR